MRKISIDELNDMVDSRYSLVTIISKRARQIIDGSEPLVKTNTKKPVGIAIEEFHEGQYEAIYDYDKYKKELQADINETETDNIVEETHGQEEKSDNQSND
jgi:DNA-directed RNA polymerase subunit omega